MSDVWDRINNELLRRGKNWQWLADQTDYSIQRLQNWKTRGVPTGSYALLAEKLNRSIDWVAGLEADPLPVSYYAQEEPAQRRASWPFARDSLARVVDLPPQDIERIQIYIEATVHAWESRSQSQKSRAR
jgi:hypothetical protein